MLDIDRVLREDRLLRELTGLNCKDFEQLLVKFEIALKQQSAIVAEKNLRKLTANNNNTKEKLLLILFYRKYNPSFDVAGRFFDLSRSRVHLWTILLNPALETALGQKMGLQERKLESMEQFITCFPHLKEMMNDRAQRSAKGDRTERSLQPFSEAVSEDFPKNLQFVSKQLVIVELAILFFKLGSIGFGGMAVLISMMEDEVVSQRRWLTREQFLDLLGASNLIPGPTAVEVAIQVGYLRANWLGFIVSGLCFILPSTLITIALAWSYEEFNSFAKTAPFLVGIKSVIPAVICLAVWKLGKTAIKSRRLAMISFVVAIASILGVNEMIAILLGGFIGIFCFYFNEGLPSSNKRKTTREKITNIWIFKLVVVIITTLTVIGLIDFVVTGEISLWKLGLFFLKVGTLLYGGGYVLIAFLQGGLVNELEWLTQSQLLDAIAVGQITPGPLLSSVTFIGYLLLGFPGATVATAAIVLPSFCFSAALNSVIPQLRRWRWSIAFLDAVNVSAIALMATVTIKLSQSALNSWQSWAIALVCCSIGLLYRVNVTFLMLGGAILGWLLFSL